MSQAGSPLTTSPSRRALLAGAPAVAAAAGPLPSSMQWPAATGDYVRDCVAGQRAALKYLADVEAKGSDGGGFELRNVIFGMPRDFESWTGVHVGFCSMVEIAAVAGRSRAQEVADYWATKSRDMRPPGKNAEGT